MKNKPVPFGKDGRTAWIAALLTAVILAYLPVFSNQFVSWDDGVYIIDNPLIKTFSLSNLSAIFGKSFEGHYHPFTLLSLSLDYHLWGLNPVGFHAHNLFLHLVNTVLVFLIVRKLTFGAHLAGLAALLFGLHPQHVEAVAWATARKDVLYSLYFLLSLWSYLQYKKLHSRRLLYLSFFAFIFSVLSKGQGVFLPFCLLLIDHAWGDSLRLRATWTNKLPFFGIALFLGIVAYLTQRSTGYTGESVAWPTAWNTLLIAFSSFAFYIYKFLLPINLSAYYPVPGTQGLALYLMATAGFLLMAGLFWWMKRTYKRAPLVFFGLAFFLVNIGMFLRWIPISNYLIADRYTYMASMGIFILAGKGWDWLYSHPRWRSYSYVLVPLLIVTLAGLTFQRSQVWRDSLSLTNNILVQYPDVYPALNARGNEWMARKDYKAALEDFNHAIIVQPSHSRGWANRGSLYFKTGDIPKALHDFKQAVILEPGNPRILNNRGLLLDALGRREDALADFNRAIQISPGFSEAYNNKGMTLAKMDRCKEALGDFDTAIETDRNMAKAYANRGKCRNQTSDFEGAIRDFQKCIDLDLKVPLVYYEMGQSFYNLKDFSKAIQNFDQALSLQPDYLPALTYRAYAQFNMGDFVSALQDLDKVMQAGSTDPLAFAMRGMSLVKLGRKEEACQDFQKARDLGLIQVEKQITKYCN